MNEFRPTFESQKEKLLEIWRGEMLPTTGEVLYLKGYRLVEYSSTVQYVKVKDGYRNENTMELLYKDGELICRPVDGAEASPAEHPDLFRFGLACLCIIYDI